MRLTKEFFYNDTKKVAKELLGKLLVRKLKNNIILSGIICETEAYLGVKDKACHTYNNKKTNRTYPMWLEGGHSYIYFIYGKYFCFNIVTETENHGTAVLIRSLIPYQGIDIMLKNRGINNIKNLTNGPGKICQALAIDKNLNAVDLTASKDLWIESYKKTNAKKIIKTKRIGIDYADDWADKKLRFCFS